MTTSINIYTVDAGTAVSKQFAVNFTLGFLSRDHVTAFVEDELDGGGDQIFRTITWINDGLVTLSGTLSVNDIVKIQRTTPADNLIHDFQAGAVLREGNLDEAHLQALMILHEVFDGRNINSFSSDLNMNQFDILNINDAHADRLFLGGVELTFDTVFTATGIRPVNTIADLRAGASSGLYVATLGYYSVGDGGGASYYYDASDTTTADDGFLCIVASDGGRWKLNEGPTVQVKATGAAGDGITDDTTAVSAAVVRANTVGKPLKWLPETYLTTASIPNLHDVEHVGPGIIKRGSDLFHVSIADDQTNNLYVATTGSALSDGLSSSEPMLILQNAFDVLVGYGPVLDGTWIISLAAGTYTTFGSGTRIAELNSGLLSKNPIVVQGPDVSGHPNEPTAFLGPPGTTQTSGNGIFITNGSRLKVKDIKVRNLTGLGISADKHCELLTENAHTFNIGNFGISAISLCDLDVKGGIIDGHDNTNNGIRSLFACRHSVGSATGADIVNGPVIQNCTTGFLAQEGATGHSDYVEYLDNTTAIQATVNARVNAAGSDFKRNTIAMRSELGAVILDTNVELNLGGANSNTENYRVKSGSWQAKNNEYNTRSVAALDYTTDTVTGTTAEQESKVFPLEAGNWTSVPSSIYQGKVLRVRATGSITGTAGTKSFRLRIDSSLVIGVTLDADAANFFDLDFEVFLTSSSAQKSRVLGVAQNGAKRIECAYGTSAINTDSATDQELRFTIQLGNSADSVSVEIFQVEVQG